jgi:hypothetical protein
MQSKRTHYLNNENLPLPATKHNYTPEMIEEIAKCKKDLIYFAQSYFTIINIDDGEKKIELYPAQKRVLKSLCKNRFVVTLASRQVGKSTLMCVYSLWKACFIKHQRIVIAANREDTAIEIFSRVKMAYEQLPNWLKPGVEKWGETGMKLENGSYLSVETTSPNTGRGKATNLIIVDEMAFIAPNIMAQFWKSVSATISSSKTAQIFVVSTANGTDNMFYEIYKNATSAAPTEGLDQWHAETIHWSDVPGRGKKWKESMLASLNGDEEAFAQEYDNKFISTGSGSVDEAFIDDMRQKAREPILQLDDGHYKIFDLPDKTHVYTIGVDVSDGIGEAASVAEVYDITDLGDIKQVAEYHNRQIEPLAFTRKLYQIALQWGSPMLAIERNNMGGTVVDTLVTSYHYTRLLDFLPSKQSDRNKRGVFSHTNVRHDSVLNMRYWVNHLRCVDVRSGGLIDEFRTFVKHSNGIWKKNGSRNTWDDRVMATVWALFVLENGIVEKYYDVYERDRNGKVSKLVDPYGFYEYAPISELTLAVDPVFKGQMPVYFDPSAAEFSQEDINYLYAF